MNNSIRHPEAWDFYIAHARNIKNEPDISHLGNYRIPDPRKENFGQFIYAFEVTELWEKFIDAWYIYGTIQYIVQNF